MVRKKEYAIGIAMIVMAILIIFFKKCTDRKTVEFEHNTVSVSLPEEITDVVYGGTAGDGFFYATSKEGFTLYYQVATETAEPEIIMTSDEAFMIDMYVFDNKLIYEEALFGNDGIITNIYYAAPEGSVTLLFSEVGSSMAYTGICGDFLLVSEDKFLSDSIHESELFTIDLKKNTCVEIYSSTYTVGSDNLCQGESIVYAGGDNDNVFFQVITMDNEYMETAKDVHLYKYSMEQGEVVGQFPLEKKVLHIGGSENALIISEYDYFTPLTNSGKILTERNGKLKVIKEIDGIQSGDDIIKSYVKEKRIHFFNNQCYYLYDIPSQRIYQYMYNDDDKQRSRAVLDKAGLSFLEKDENGVALHRIMVGENGEE